MYELSDDKKYLNQLERIDFSSIKLTEKDIEDILVNRIGILDEEDDSDEENGSLLIVGRQVRNKGNGRSDLTAIDKDGNLVLIEIKRDAKDIKARQESFTFQAIRYVASYSTIKTVADLAKQVYVPFLGSYKKDVEPKQGQNIQDLAVEKLNEFLGQNNKDELSGKQRIILVAGEFDEQTLSASDWLCKNKIDITCVQLNLFRTGEKIFLDAKRLIPQEDFILPIADSGLSKSLQKNNSSVKARLPKIDVLMREGVLVAGDILEAKDHAGECVKLQENCLVKIMETQKESLKEIDVLSMQQWLRKVFEWDAVDTYKFVLVKESKNTENNGLLIYDVRAKWMAAKEKESDSKEE